MNSVRDNLLDRMIAIYGLEHQMTVQFAYLCEQWDENEWNDKVLTLLVESHEADPIYETDEEAE